MQFAYTISHPSNFWFGLINQYCRRKVISEKYELPLTPMQVTISLPQETKFSIYDPSKIQFSVFLTFIFSWSKMIQNWKVLSVSSGLSRSLNHELLPHFVLLCCSFTWYSLTHTELMCAGYAVINVAETHNAFQTNVLLCFQWYIQERLKLDNLQEKSLRCLVKQREDEVDRV